MAKSDPSWKTRVHMVSIAAVLNSLLPAGRALMSGWMIRDAYSDRLTLFASPPIVVTAALRIAGSEWFILLTITGRHK